MHVHQCAVSGANDLQKRMGLRIRAMQDRFDQLSLRIAGAYQDVPMGDVLAEIDEAVASGRRG